MRFVTLWPLALFAWLGLHASAQDLVRPVLRLSGDQVELRWPAGMPVADLIRQVGISEQTYYRWKKQYAGLQSDQVRELKLLQDENGRLKKLVAELSLDKAILQDVNSKKWPGPR